MARRRLGDILIDMNLITQEQLDSLLQEQKTTHERLGEILLRHQLLTEGQLIEILEFQLGVPHLNLYRFQIDPSVIALIPERLARRHMAMPVRVERNKLLVAMADPLDFYAIDNLRMATGLVIEPGIAARQELQQFIDRFYGMSDSVGELESRLSKDVDIEQQVTDENSPVVRLVNQMIAQAITQRASDIHLDPYESDIHIRYRVDGTMHTEQVLSRSMYGVLLARLKIMAGLNIAERRLPQDGRMQVTIQGRPIDIRVATLATVHGEKCVMRLLDRTTGLLNVDNLNLSVQNRDRFLGMIEAPYGMVLISGPTGSGKTSTLYAALSNMSATSKNIITVEDPVEYQLPGINQVQVNPAIGMNFARGLRAILRQDPDIVMVGEIRDGETAEIAVRSALTGHLVFTTIHTNDAISSVMRLMDMGVEPFLVASALTGVVAQRLVRKVCKACAAPHSPTDGEQQWFDSHGFHELHMQRGLGCPECHNTGYYGRLAVHEVLEVDNELRSLMMKGIHEDKIREYAQAHGMRTMFEDGLEKVASGRTTLEEVLRVTM